MQKFYKILLICLPKDALTCLIGYLANKKISKFFIQWFAKKYQINLQEAQKDITQYQTLNDFFTRKLKTNCRQLKKDNQFILCPVDGTIAQMGIIDGSKIIQAKDHNYNLEQLLQCQQKAQKYHNGYFMTIYLSPQDYHRIHHFCDGEVIGYDYIPGKLFAVNPFSVNNINNLFAINERLTTYYNQGQHQPAIVKVGATIVGKIEVTYDNFTKKLNRHKKIAKIYTNPIPISQGDELGCFKMGSTIILLFEKKSFKVDEKYKIEDKVQLGDNLGKWLDK